MSKTILILGNSDGGLFNFRRELLEKLISQDYYVVVSVPYGERVEDIKKIGCSVIDAPINRRGLSIFEEIKLIRYYNKIITSIKPNVILTYTIKPNIYGGLAAKNNRVSYIANITGLGSALTQPNKLQRFVIYLYKLSLSNVSTIFFQNKKNKTFFIENDIVAKNYKLLPGSGVNLNHFQILKYPVKDTIEFVFVSRIMKEKGINEYLEAAEYITKKYSNTKFHICGEYEENYKELIHEKHDKEIIQYHGKVKDIRKILSKVHCIVHPSYHEGMSNVLLEAAASGRPIIASNIPGCRETFDERVSGLSFEKKDREKLIEVIENFIRLTYEEKEQMGLAGRKKMELQFDRKIVVDKYIKEIELALEEI